MYVHQVVGLGKGKVSKLYPLNVSRKTVVLLLLLQVSRGRARGAEPYTTSTAAKRAALVV